MLINCIRCLIVVALVGACGCGKPKKTVSEKIAEKIAEKAMESGSKGEAKVDISGDAITVKSKDGTVALNMNGTTVPESFPKDVPVPKSGKIISSVSTPKGSMISIETTVALAAAAKEFSDGMKSNGWTEESTYNAAEQSIVSYKKDKRTTLLMATAIDGKTTLAITSETAD